MTSQFEDTTVDELDVENYSDDQLRDIAENDSRVTAQEKAQAELTRRENDTTPEDTPADDALDANDVKERDNPQPEAPVKNSVGEESAPLSEDLGAGQVQHKMDQAVASGTWPGDGQPPDSSHTVEAVTQVPAADPETFASTEGDENA